MKIKNKLNGCIVSIITPMKKNKNIDFNEFKKLLNKLLNKVDGFVICGTTGESTSINTKEKIKLAKISRKIIKNGKPLIFGNSEIDTYKAIKLNLKLKKIGIDVILQNVPYYVCKNSKNILAHFKEINKYNIPIILYNVPSRTGVDISLKTIIKISKFKNIIAIKESSYNIIKILEIKYNTNLKCFSGDDITSPLSFFLGADGIISVTANIFPEIISKSFKEAKINKEIYNFNKMLFIESNPCPIKYIMKKKKIIKSCTTRLPLINISKNNKKKIIKAYNNVKKNI
ncbi:4-hydroxy-tetrahydrodipicolinate synthase [Candidatus Vidania fulgoroideae]|uniref:4-hydroxy-tetrahydrodipicolinate synthase n=1 Tax=Candidatus Vidania fulgoroideorum TaxID=881286 RepID=A0AAX3N8X4_9PROT|nr:4-hydroxy-tetrahydrodipicolinate synthase [Candidatus Vidania fulgoroideae]WDR79405.1 4-hydroxy-tetrahydrodipicolinate synthase [Candidatus Vidania fulgoroideae]